MKNKKFLISVGVVVLVLILGSIIFLVGPRLHADECTQLDRMQNNCVPAGHCAPAGDPRDATIDCLTTDYDHKFSQ